MRAAWRVNRGDGDAADDGKGDDGDGMVRMKATTMIIDVDARDDCDDGNWRRRRCDDRKVGDHGDGAEDGDDGDDGWWRCRRRWRR